MITGDSRAIASAGESAGFIRTKVVNELVGGHVTALGEDNVEITADGDEPHRTAPTAPKCTAPHRPHRTACRSWSAPPKSAPSIHS
ncbi:hypothetical protein [Kitasatospora nipponensis]|uniref:hypothetical protein n=1 Tax=Kitasatospora nipponensis TaxID=258049 RepID=UPI0031D027CC